MNICTNIYTYLYFVLKDREEKYVNLKLFEQNRKKNNWN